MKWTGKKILFLLIPAILLIAKLPTDIYGRKIRTKLPVKTSSANSVKAADEKSDTHFYNDSTPGFEKIKNLVRFYGFDKTVSSNTESFFIVNSSDSSINHMSVEITYFDMQGRQLHQRISEFDCDLPAHQTRRKDIRSWDTQKSFYFHQSAKPRRQATPFDISVALKSVTFNGR